MAQRVFRYPIKPPYPLIMALPHETMWVKFGFAPQSDEISIWAVVLDNEPLQKYGIMVVGTGHEVDEDWNYFDTYIDNDGYVWHLFSKSVM